MKHGVDGKVKKKVLASTLAKAGGQHLDSEMSETIKIMGSIWQPEFFPIQR